MINKTDYIESLPDTYELLLASFFATNSAVVAKLIEQWAKRDPTHQRYFGRSHKKTQALSSKDFGGAVVVIDPNRLDLGFIAEIEVPVAFGMYFRPENKSLYVSANQWIKRVHSGKIVETLGNNLFNDIHALAGSPDGNLLVVSTGVDGILEVSFENTQQVIWDWLATEHGFDAKPNGEKRTIDRSENYQKIGTSTPHHTTHINSCLPSKPNKILATLFHQGLLVEINRSTGKVVTKLSGLESPHHIRETLDGYLVSDTNRNCALLLDKNFNTIQVLEGGYNRVHDAVELRDGSFVIGDSNNDRFVKVNGEGHQVDELKWKPKTRKAATFLPVSAKHARTIFYE